MKWIHHIYIKFCLLSLVIISFSSLSFECTYVVTLMQETYLSILQFLKINVIYGWFELREEKGEQKGVEV